MNYNTIPAIETTYAGCRFRSRLEARWAVFFDTLGVPWQYEPQGFQLVPLPPDFYGSSCTGRCDHRDCTIHLGAYLPDFWLPQQNTWFEVKGSEPSENEWERLYRFMHLALPRRTLVAIGDIPNPETVTIWGPPAELLNIHTLGDDEYCWTLCDVCSLPDVQWGARTGRVRCGCHEQYPGDRCTNGNDPKLLRAYAAARSARFEHGERP